VIAVSSCPVAVLHLKHGNIDDQVDTVVQPDVLIVCDLHKLDDRGMSGAPGTGSPKPAHR